MISLHTEPLYAGKNFSVSANLDLANSELGEPMHTTLPPPQKSLWWKWTAPADGDQALQWSDDSRALALQSMPVGNWVT